MDLIAQKVLGRYKLAEASLWERALQDMRQFNKKYAEAHAIKDVNDDSAQKLLGEFAFRKDGTAPSFPGSAFQEWMSKAFGMEIDDPDAVRPRGAIILGIADGRGDLQTFLDDLDIYARALNDVVKEAAPERFVYQGFKIFNPEHFGDYKARKLLEGIDYVVALFKKKGLDHLLKEGVTQVNLAFDLGGDTLGLYHPASQEISMSGKAIDLGTGRFMKWVNEIFLHEFGHYVHMHYLSKEAREVWNSGWNEVKDKKKLYDEAFKSITAAERMQFFDLLKASGWDPSKAAKKLEPISRVKFGVWLRNPSVNDPLITPSQFRWSKSGLYMAQFFKEPAKFMKDHYDLEFESDTDAYNRQYARSEKQFLSKLGLLDGHAQAIPSEVVEEMSKADPAMKKTVDEAIEKLEIVSGYGKTDEYEDFAESFVAFVGAPEKLTPTAKFRMQQALSLSGLYGKHVMHLAKRPSINLP